MFGVRVAVATVALVLTSGLSACTSRESVPNGAPRVTSARAPLVDDFGDTLLAGPPAQRIASLNPTTTEIVFAIGAGARVVGRTTWDTYPAEARRAPDLGPGIRPSVEAILAAKPDLVLLYATEDNRPAARQLRAAGVRTLSLRIDRIADFTRATQRIGWALGDSARAAQVVDSVMATLDRVRRATRNDPRPTVAWRLYEAPLLVAGGGSFLSELIDIAGGRNVYADRPEPSPQVALEDLVARNPEVLLVGPDAVARIGTMPQWQGVRAVRTGRVVVPDTALIGRPAVRLGEAAVAIARLLHPTVVP